MAYRAVNVFPIRSLSCAASRSPPFSRSPRHFPPAPKRTCSSRFLDNCRRNSSSEAQFCEIRDFSLPALRGLVVNGRQNGGITVTGWDQANIKIVAMVQVRAESETEAAAIARDIAISVSNGDVQATGPRLSQRHESWSVSYEIFAPRTIDLALTASNGGIAVEGINGRMDLETVNGGLTVVDVSGDVRGRTVNGGVTAELFGDRWAGAGLDLKTSNGGVTISVPSNYSAQLETGTVNGGLNVGFPITLQGSGGRRISTQLGSGGPTISVTTTNGGVNLKRR